MMLKIKGSVRKGRSKCLFWPKFCVAWLFNPDWSKAAAQNLFWWNIALFELWFVWYPHVAFSLMNVLIKRLLFAYFDKKVNKLIVSVFSSTLTSGLLHLHCELDQKDWQSFDCSYLYHLFHHQDCLGLLRKLIFLLVFFKINEFLKEAAQFHLELSRAFL